MQSTHIDRGGIGIAALSFFLLHLNIAATWGQPPRVPAPPIPPGLAPRMIAPSPNQSEPSTGPVLIAPPMTKVTAPMLMNAAEPPPRLPFGRRGGSRQATPSPLTGVSAPPEHLETDIPFRTEMDPTLGYSGPSSVLPSDLQESSHAFPVEDRWRLGFPAWDRLGKANDPKDHDYPYVLGRWWDPYNQNYLKGDYPIIGQHTFLNVTLTSFSVTEGHRLPTGTTPFESTQRPNTEEFFGRPNRLLYSHNFSVSLDLNHGDSAFKPTDWRIKITPVFNLNVLDTNELAVVHPDVRLGTERARTFLALEEWFVEAKLFDISADYDFVSVRGGSQFFNSDFRGFVFADTNRAIRLFGTRQANRDQFNLVFFDQTDKDTNSALNNYRDRNQHTVIANYYRQDFLFPGYTIQGSFHYNNDKGSQIFDKNNTLVRPAAAGVFQPHEVNAFYVGLAGDGHLDRLNISHAFYWVFGHDSLNPLANRETRINAQMAAVEFSYDRDWARFRGSFFWASGDNDINDRKAEGFDAIFDNPAFAGGGLSFWQRQAIQLFGVNLTNRGSLLPDLTPSKIQGQANFVNPGLLLINFGLDMDITPKLKLINNANFLWFDKTQTLEQFTFDGDIDRAIGTDLSVGLEYRPFLNNNVIALLGFATLLPAEGFKDLYNELNSPVQPLFAGFLELTLTY